MDEQQPRFAVGTDMPQRERFRICEVPQKTRTSSHRGLADAISPDQISANVDAAELLRSNGSAAVGRRERIRIKSFFSNGFAVTWTIFQDTPTVRFPLCCAISAGVLHRMSSSSHPLLQQLLVR